MANVHSSAHIFQGGAALSTGVLAPVLRVCWWIRQAGSVVYLEATTQMVLDPAVVIDIRRNGVSMLTTPLRVTSADSRFAVPDDGWVAQSLDVGDKIEIWEWLEGDPVQGAASPTIQLAVLNRKNDG